MYRLSVLLTMIFVLGFAASAQACLVCATSDTKQEEIISDAVFIGVIRIDDVNYIERPERELRETKVEDILDLENSKQFKIGITPLQTLRGHISSDDDVFVFWGNDCNSVSYKKGRIYRVIILKKDGVLQFVGGCQNRISDERWLKLESGKKKSPVYQKIESECSSSNGQWVFQATAGVCKHASKDARKSCLDSRECEGICIGSPTKDQKEIMDEALFNHTTPHIKSVGRCSETTDQKNCRFSVEYGFLQNRCGLDY